MTPAERRLLERVRRRAATMRPDLSRRLLSAYKVIREALSEAEMVRAIESGAADTLINSLLDDRALDPAFAPLRELMDRAAIDEGASWTKQLPGREAKAVFEVLNPRVLDAIVKLDGRVIQGLKDEVRETVRESVRIGVEAGKNPRAIARGVKDAIGLSPKQAQAVANFRAELEAGDRSALQRALAKNTITTPDGGTTVRSGHAGGKGLTERQLGRLDKALGNEPLPKADVDRAVESYRQRMTALNAETHTRSIALDAQRLAQRNSWQSAIDRGIVDAARLQRTWIAAGGPTGDGRNRPEHLAMHGQTVKYNEPYSNGDMVVGEGDYGCRCVERITLIPEAKAAA